MFGIIAALLSGALMSIQGVFNRSNEADGDMAYQFFCAVYGFSCLSYYMVF